MLLDWRRTAHLDERFNVVRDLPQEYNKAALRPSLLELD
jgi:hypothetical protein